MVPYDAVYGCFVVDWRGKLFTGDPAVPGWSRESVPESEGSRFVGSCRGLISRGSGAQAASLAIVNCSKWARVSCGVLSMLIPLGNLGTWDARRQEKCFFCLLHGRDFKEWTTDVR